MSAQVASLAEKEHLESANGLQRVVLFVVFLICSLLILVFGSNYFAIFPTNKNLAFQLSLSGLFLVAAAWFKRDERMNPYWQIAFAFFIASFATAIMLLFGGSVLLTSIVFALMHSGATYLTPVAIPFIVANTLTLGLACGYLMMKTNSIWGPTLIHAASDLFLFIAMLAAV